MRYVDRCAIKVTGEITELTTNTASECRLQDVHCRFGIIKQDFCMSLKSYHGSDSPCKPMTDPYNNSKLPYESFE